MHNLSKIERAAGMLWVGFWIMVDSDGGSDIPMSCKMVRRAGLWVSYNISIVRYIMDGW